VLPPLFLSPCLRLRPCDPASAPSPCDHVAHPTKSFRSRRPPPASHSVPLARPRDLVDPGWSWPAQWKSTQAHQVEEGTKLTTLDLRVVINADQARRRWLPCPGTGTEASVSKPSSAACTTPRSDLRKWAEPAAVTHTRRFSETTHVPQAERRILPVVATQGFLR
jgi:hypothetical protein